MKFKERADKIMYGDATLLIAQSFISLPFYYYFKENEINYLVLIPLVISYFLIRSALKKTDYDFDPKTHLDEESGRNKYYLTYGLIYWIYGFLGAAIINFLLFLLGIFRVFFNS